MTSQKEYHETDQLLSRFMQMRGNKGRISVTTEAVPCNTASTGKSKSKVIKGSPMKCAREAKSVQETIQADTNEWLATSSPDVSVPTKTGCCLVSIQLGPSVIRHIEEVWPAEHLIDRDFNSQLASTGLSSASGGVASFAAEVDVSLTSDTGLISTTLLQIKQKPLPGSHALTTVRQRIYNLSLKYKTLIIFVAETASSKEDRISLSTSDMAAYTDFVCFTTSLRAIVTVCLLPGAAKTLARWILSVMAKYAPQAAGLHYATSLGDTSWELFFRQSGMNVRAAQILAHRLFEDFGTSGLAKFLAMGSSERGARYGSVLNLEEELLQAACLWDEE